MASKLVWFIAIAGVGMGSALAQDAQKVGPDVYKCVLENERVRVCEVTFKPGVSIAMHSHPDHVVYFMQGGSLKVTDEAGTVHDVSPMSNKAVWAPGERHSAVNVGTTTIKAIMVELK
jgi:quercetin dioxygenase-like cupin family protein